MTEGKSRQQCENYDRCEYVEEGCGRRRGATIAAKSSARTVSDRYLLLGTLSALRVLRAYCFSMDYLSDAYVNYVFMYNDICIGDAALVKSCNGAMKSSVTRYRRVCLRVGRDDSRRQGLAGDAAGRSRSVCRR